MDKRRKTGYNKENNDLEIIIMKKLVHKIDIFCYRHPKFGIPNLMLYIVIANALVWLFSLMDTSGVLVQVLAFSPYHILRGQVWRLFSFALLPFTYSYLTLISFYFYYFIGRTIEKEWGSGKFTIYFLFGLVLTVLYGFIVYFAESAGADELTKQLVSWTVASQVGAYYIYLSMFFTFATLYPDMQVLLFFIIPVKMKWLGLLDLAFFIYAVVTTPFPYALLPVVAVLNYLIFCGYSLFAYFSPAKLHRRQRTIEFKSMDRMRQKIEQERPYSRKCEVCGRTDTDYPDLEFRYCSRCKGFHCYCMDHINNHRHVTDE